MDEFDQEELYGLKTSEGYLILTDMDDLLLKPGETIVDVPGVPFGTVINAGPARRDRLENPDDRVQGLPASWVVRRRKKKGQGGLHA